jgi:MFS family permease
MSAPNPLSPWGRVRAAVGGALKAPAYPHPARYRAVELKRIHRRDTLHQVLWSTLIAGPYFATVMGAAVVVLASVAKLSDRWYGLIQAMPALGMLIQIPASYIVGRASHRPRVLFYVGLFGRAVWIPIAVVPLVLKPGPEATATFLALIAFSWVCFHIGSLAWQAFMGDLVPRKRRGKYFGARLRIFSISNFLASLGLAFALPAADQWYAPWVLLGIFTFAAVTGIIELWIYKDAYDPPRKKTGVGLADLLAPLRDASFRPFLVFGFLIAASNGILGPFLWRHFLVAQHMDPWKVTLILQSAAIVGMFLMAGVWGFWIDRHGSKAAIIVALVTANLITFAWPIVHPETWWLGLGIQLTAVMFWVGVDVGINNRLFAHGAGGGPGYFAIFNATLAVAGFVFTAIGGEIAERLTGRQWVATTADWLGRNVGLSFSVYIPLLVLCVVLRFVALAVLVWAIRRDQPQPTALAVRAIAGQMHSGVMGLFLRPLRRGKPEAPGQARSEGPE